MSDTVVFSLDNLVGLGRHRGDTFGPHRPQVRSHLVGVVLAQVCSSMEPFGRFAGTQAGTSWPQ